VQVWYDPFGFMEALSRKLKVSLFVPYGRFGLPIPFRCNITMTYADPISVEKVAEPSQQQVDELHQRLLASWSELFESHKVPLGQSHKTLNFV